MIRRARFGDADVLARLIGQLGYTASAGEVADRLASMEAEGRAVLVAERDGAVVGCLTTSIMRVLHRPAPVGRISMMVVEEAMRGQGIGASLVRAAEEALAAHGCYMVEVTSNLRRTEAHRFSMKSSATRAQVSAWRRSSRPFRRQLSSFPAARSAARAASPGLRFRPGYARC